MVPLFAILLLSFSYCFAGIVLIVASIIGAYSLYIVYVRMKYRSLKNPEFKNFFLGNVAEIIAYKYDRHLLWLKWGRECGEIFKVCIFHKVLVILASPALVKKVLLNKSFEKPDEVYKNMSTVLGIRWMGKGILTLTDHSTWTIHRKMMTPSFNRLYLKELLSVFNRKTDELIVKFNELSASNSEISMLDYLGRTTLDVICEAAFSFNSNSIKDKTSPFPKALYTALKVMTESFHDIFMKWNPLKRHIVREGQDAMKYIRSVGEKLIRERLDSISRGEKTPYDLLDILARCDREQISMDLLIDNFVTIFIAGQETTANATAFLFHLLGHNPKVYMKIKEEIDSVLGDKQYIDYNDMMKLTYTEACWKEGLRLFPVAYGTAREVRTKTEIDGHNLPIGTVLFTNFILVHHLFNPDGSNFNPDRIHNKVDEPYTFLPFSAGQRSCIGRHFASFESKILIAKIIRNFDFTLVEGQSTEVEECLTLRMKDGVKVKLTSRKSPLLTNVSDCLECPSD